MEFNIKSNLFKRVIVALIGGCFFLIMLIFNKWSYFCLFLGLNILTLSEFYKITSVNKSILLNISGIFFSIYIYILIFLFYSNILGDYRYLLSFILIPYIILMLGLFQNSIEQSFKYISYCILGLIYISIPFSMLHMLSFSENNYKFGYILSIFLLTWSNDTGAFCIGKMFGRNKLNEKISPKKTWEGVLGGFLFSIIVGYILSKFPFFRMDNWYILAPLIFITGILGDLIASLLKRNFKIKDSGNSLPGHGGLLDRFDSVIISIPFLVIFKILINN